MGAFPFRRRPALRLALLTIAGILLAEWGECKEISVLLPVVLLSFCTLAVTFVHRADSSLVLHLAFGVLVFSVHSLQMMEQERDFVEPLQERDRVAGSGIVESLSGKTGTSYQLLLADASIQRNATRPVSGKRLLMMVRRAAPASDSALSIGAMIRFTAEVVPFPRPRNPGEFDYGRYLRLNRVEGILRAGKQDTVTTVQSPSPRSFPIAVAGVREELGNVFDRLHSGRVAAFLRGIILADRRDIAPEVKESFVNTGTIHVLAVSGLHVGIVAVAFVAVFGLLRIPKRVVPLVTIVALVSYMTLIGAPPSVARATLMASIVLLASVLQRQPDIINSLATAAVLLLLWDSGQLFDVGFQLSFAAVFSIVLLYPPLERLIRRIPERLEEVKALDYVLKLFAVSLAAQLGTLPFTAYYFGRISVVSLAANIIVVPVIGVTVMIAFATLAFSILMPLAGLFAEVNEVLVRFIIGFVENAARIPFAYFEVPATTMWFPVFFYLTLLLLFGAGRPSLVKGAVLLLLLAANVFLLGQLITERRPSVTLTVIDVGQGDALLLEFPNGKHLLVDAGPRTMSFDAGERIVVPFLKRAGIRSLDAVVLSHPHSDHIGGVPAVLKNAMVGSVIDIPIQPISKLHQELRFASDSLRIPVRPVERGARIEPDSSARVYVLHPSFPADSSANMNNTSIVLKVVYGERSLLLVGDVEKEAEQKIARRYGAFLKSDILKVGHHGSSTSSDTSFLDSVSPSEALISVGRENKFKHPSPEVLERLRKRNIAVARTDEEGALILSLDGFSVRRVHWRN